MPRRHYPPSIILNAITEYNLGKTILEVKACLLQRFKKDVPQSTIHAWLTQFKDVCTFLRYRKKYSISEKETIITHVFAHRQEYKFAFHRLKTNILCKINFPGMRRYLWDIREHCPRSLFINADNSRCSEVTLHNIKFSIMHELENQAVLLARLGMVLAKKATERHQVIQRFMLANDTATIAVEVPVYLYPNEALDLGLTSPLTGHIDLLQVRCGCLYILDYKPDAKHETKAKYQIYLYARALSVRTGISMDKIRLGYFDDKDYYTVKSG